MPELRVVTDQAEARLELDAETLERRAIEYRPKLAGRLETDLELLEPKGTRFRVATKGVVTGQTIRVGIFGLPFARAYNRGAFIVAKGADHRHPGAEGPRALKFASGVFRRFAVIKGTHYFDRALARVPGVAEDTFEREFDGHQP